MKIVKHIWEEHVAPAYLPVLEQVEEMFAGAGDEPVPRRFFRLRGTEGGDYSYADELEREKEEWVSGGPRVEEDAGG